MTTLAHPLRPSPAVTSDMRVGGADQHAWALRIAKSAWQALELAGQRRARHALLRLADQHAATQPDLAARLREAACHIPMP